MLHDVLRKVGEVREIDVLLPNQILALPHAARDDARRCRHREEHDPEKAGGGIGGDVGAAFEVQPDRVQEHGEYGHRGEEECAARRQHECEAPHRDQQQKPQAARNATACVQQQHQTRDVDRRLENGLNPGACHAPAHQDNAAQAETQVEDRDSKEELRRIDGDAARPPQRIETEEHQRHQHPVQIEEPEHAPIEGDLRAAVAVERAGQNVHGTDSASHGDFALGVSLIQNSAPQCDQIGTDG